MHLIQNLNVLMETKEDLFNKLWGVLYSEEIKASVDDSEIRQIVERLYRIVTCPEPDYEMLRENIRYSLLKRRKRKCFLHRLYRCAGVLCGLIVLIMGGLILFEQEENSFRETKNSYERPQNGIYLTLHDGARFDLRNKETNCFVEDGSVSIIQDSTLGLIYEQKECNDTTLRYNTLEIPVASNYRIQLSDGTVVYLNSASKLRYPEVFKGDERKVYLEGEGFFDVAKDSTRPFRVEVGCVEIEVLGTCFNVNAYPEKDGVIATIEEGRVRLAFNEKNVILKAGEQVSCVRDSIEVRNVNVREFTSWKEGLFIFNRMSLRDIMTQMERWYGLSIHFLNPDIGLYTFTGVIDKDLDADETFRVIEKMVNVKFSRKGNEVMVIKK